MLSRGEVSYRRDQDFRRTVLGLSYAWGETGTENYITCEGQKVSVTKNCDEALRRLREKMHREASLLWVDAICIDQSNLEERPQQVELFADIYSSASRTCIWLGEKIETTEFAVSLLKILDQLHRGINPCSKLEDDHILAALRNLSPEKFRTGFKLFVTTIAGR
jgi:hypothetical protein